MAQDSHSKTAWWDSHPDNAYFVCQGFGPRAGRGVWIKEVDGVGVFRVSAPPYGAPSTVTYRPWLFWFRSWDRSSSLRELDAVGLHANAFEDIIGALGGA